MRSILSSVLVLLFVLAGGADAQTLVNPATQIRWPMISGTVDPVAPAWPCTTATYGQPYTNTATNKLFICGSGGWSLSSGGGGTIQATPQYRLFIQPTPGSAAVAGPATTAQNAVTTLLQGVGNPDLFATSNNGVANFLGLYATGNGVVPPNSTSTEVFGLPDLPSGSAITDLRGNAFYQYGHDNAVTTMCDPHSYDPGSGSYYTNCFTNKFARQVYSHIANDFYCDTVGNGYNLGTTGLSTAGLWSVRHCLYGEPDLGTRGIGEWLTSVVHKSGIGDTGGVRSYVDAKGGCTEGSCEGAVALYGSSFERTVYYHGTVSTGGVGASQITGTFVSGDNHFGDCSYLLNITKGALYNGIAAAFPFDPFISGGALFLTATITSPNTTFPVSTAWGVAQTGTDAAANGKYQINVPQTIAFTLGSGAHPTPGNFAVNDIICIVGTAAGGGFTETSKVTAVSGSGGVGGTQNVTFTTRYAYPTGFAIMANGMCGQYATPTAAAASWRTAIKVVGAFSSTQIVIAPQIAGKPTSSDASGNSYHLYVQTIYNADPSHSVTFYPGAEITGSADGTANVATLEINPVTWSSGDAIEDPNPAAQLVIGMHATCGQTTALNDGQGPCGVIEWHGPATINSVAGVVAYGPATSLLKLDPRSNTVDSFINVLGPQSRQGIIDGQGLQANVKHFWLHGSASNSVGADAVLAELADGRWEFTSGSGLTEVHGSNVPDNPTATGMMPISTSTGFGVNYFSSWTNVTPHGDWTINTSGVTSVSGVNGVSISGTPSVGYVPTATSSTTATWQPAGALPSSHGFTASLTGTFALNTMVGPVFYIPSTIAVSHFKQEIVRQTGGVCTVQPNVSLMDLGTSPSTMYGAATSVNTLPTGLVDGVYASSLVNASMTTGHYYGYAFSGGACSPMPVFDVTSTVQDN